MLRNWIELWGFICGVGKEELGVRFCQPGIGNHVSSWKLAQQELPLADLQDSS